MAIKNVNMIAAISKNHKIRSMTHFRESQQMGHPPEEEGLASYLMSKAFHIAHKKWKKEHYNFSTLYSHTSNLMCYFYIAAIWWRKTLCFLVFHEI